MPDESRKVRRNHDRARLMPGDIQQRLAQLRSTMPQLKLYALVDGFHYQAHYEQALEEDTHVRGLFLGTVDAHLAPSGPWLLDAESAPADLRSNVAQLERKTPSVSWIISAMDLDGMAATLQARVQVELPDGRLALLRLWDPRALANAARDFDEAQRQYLFEGITEWLFFMDNRRLRIGRHHAQDH
ncbi:DUF4123 domain-containing protein [Herbaspirillum rubrisubalbicans]|uniref:DUF4123 domain-containing protein n=1 Tax=Herbaspirillum rubrisubalbicans TaxID=80842 RepID=UPI0020A67EC9|nr:DUF4123 domain-containing protein [Herbaspirillum rubrisubalbicans]